MRKIYTKKLFLFVLIPAFLFLQWSSSHIHLGEQHNHGAGQHEHVAKIHAHDLAGHHPDAIDVAVNDSSQHTENTSVIEMDYECACSHGVPVTKTTFFEHRFFILFETQQVARLGNPPTTINPQYSYLSHSTLRLRGPPQLS